MASRLTDPWSAVAGSVGLQSPETPTLLIVDDEPLLSEYMASIAQEAGWAAEMANSAEEFETKLAIFRPAVVALDLAMPGRDGVELVRYLASHGFSGSLIIVSACDQPIVETSANLAREQGLNVAGYLQKPVAADAFTSLLGQAAAIAPKSASEGSY